jgi:hypothetical protein
MNYSTTVATTSTKAGRHGNTPGDYLAAKYAIGTVPTHQQHYHASPTDANMLAYAIQAEVVAKDRYSPIEPHMHDLWCKHAHWLARAGPACAVNVLRCELLQQQQPPRRPLPHRTAAAERLCRNMLPKHSVHTWRKRSSSCSSLLGCCSCR